MIKLPAKYIWILIIGISFAIAIFVGAYRADYSKLEKQYIRYTVKVEPTDVYDDYLECNLPGIKVDIKIRNEKNFVPLLKGSQLIVQENFLDLNYYADSILLSQLNINTAAESKYIGWSDYYTGGILATSIQLEQDTSGYEDGLLYECVFSPSRHITEAITKQNPKIGHQMLTDMRNELIQKMEKQIEDGEEIFSVRLLARVEEGKINWLIMSAGSGLIFMLVCLVCYVEATNENLAEQAYDLKERIRNEFKSRQQNNESE